MATASTSYSSRVLNSELRKRIMSADDALEKFDAGAALVQLYTGYIYEGPALIGKINRALLRRG